MHCILNVIINLIIFNSFVLGSVCYACFQCKYVFTVESPSNTKTVRELPGTPRGCRDFQILAEIYWHPYL